MFYFIFCQHLLKKQHLIMNCLSVQPVSTPGNFINFNFDESVQVRSKYDKTIHVQFVIQNKGHLLWMGLISTGVLPARRC